MKHKNKVESFKQEIVYKYTTTKITGRYPFNDNGLIRINQTKETTKPISLIILSHSQPCIKMEFEYKNFLTPWIINESHNSQKNQKCAITRCENFNSDNRIDI